MVTTGKIIEYLDNGKFVCAFVTECQNKRTRSLNQNGREINLPFSPYRPLFLGYPPDRPEEGRADQDTQVHQ